MAQVVTRWLPLYPGDQVVIYQNGLEVNGTLASGTYYTGQPYYQYVSGTYIPFGANVANRTVEIQDGLGHGHATLHNNRGPLIKVAWSVQTRKTAQPHFDYTHLTYPGYAKRRRFTTQW